MSIYQAERSKAPLVVIAVLTGLLGLAAGWLLWGRAEPDPIAALEPTRAALADAAASIEVVLAHAQFEADSGGANPDYAGSPEAIDSARSSFEGAAADVEEIAPQAAAAIREDLDELEGLVEEAAPPPDVIEAAEVLARELRTALGS